MPRRRNKNKPLGWRNSFTFYVSGKRKHKATEGEEKDESASDFRKRLAYEWKNMTAEEKIPYVELSEKVNRFFQQELCF